MAKSEVGIPKPGKRYASKRPTRDEFILEELGEQLIEAKNEEANVLLTVWDSDQVAGKIVDMDARTRKVHIVDRYGQTVKVPFLDIMKVENAGD